MNAPIVVVCVHSRLEITHVGTISGHDTYEEIELTVKCLDCCATFDGQLARKTECD